MTLTPAMPMAGYEGGRGREGGMQGHERRGSAAVCVFVCVWGGMKGSSGPREGGARSQNRCRGGAGPGQCRVWARVALCMCVGHVGLAG